MQANKIASVPDEEQQRLVEMFHVVVHMLFYKQIEIFVSAGKTLGSVVDHSWLKPRALVQFLMIACFFISSVNNKRSLILFTAEISIAITVTPSCYRSHCQPPLHYFLTISLDEQQSIYTPVM